MIWRYESRDEWWQRMGQWHRYYAWLPADTGNAWVWFDWVERRVVNGYAGPEWKYRLIGDDHE